MTRLPRPRWLSSWPLAWREARRNDDFASLAPQLREVVSLTRQIGEAKAAAMGISVYDALADEYEQGAGASSPIVWASTSRAGVST